jgi:hypothetical protein
MNLEMNRHCMCPIAISNRIVIDLHQKILKEEGIATCHLVVY